MKLVLLPGLHGTGDLFAPLLAALPPEVPVQVVPHATRAPLGYADLEQRVRMALPIDEPYVLLAESFAAPIGVSIAADPSDALRGLILCGGFVRNPQPRWSGWLAPASLLPWPPLPAWLTARLVLGSGGTAALRAELHRIVSSIPSRVIQWRLACAASVDVSDALTAVRLPLLCLHGTEDRLVPPAMADLMKSVAPRMQLVRLPAPHGLLQVLPQQAARHIVEFMGRVEAGDGSRGS